MPLIHILATTSINVYVTNAVTMQRKHFVMLRFKSFKKHICNYANAPPTLTHEILYFVNRVHNSQNTRHLFAYMTLNI
jgi:hypothetical protein